MQLIFETNVIDIKAKMSDVDVIENIPVSNGLGESYKNGEFSSTNGITKAVKITEDFENLSERNGGSGAKKQEDKQEKADEIQLENKEKEKVNVLNNIFSEDRTLDVADSTEMALLADYNFTGNVAKTVTNDECSTSQGECAVEDKDSNIKENGEENSTKEDIQEEQLKNKEIKLDTKTEANVLHADAEPNTITINAQKHDSNSAVVETTEEDINIVSSTEKETQKCPILDENFTENASFVNDEISSSEDLTDLPDNIDESLKETQNTCITRPINNQSEKTCHSIVVNELHDNKNEKSVFNDVDSTLPLVTTASDINDVDSTLLPVSTESDNSKKIEEEFKKYTMQEEEIMEVDDFEIVKNASPEEKESENLMDCDTELNFAIESLPVKVANDSKQVEKVNISANDTEEQDDRAVTINSSDNSDVEIKELSGQSPKQTDSSKSQLDNEMIEVQKDVATEEKLVMTKETDVITESKDIAVEKSEEVINEDAKELVTGESKEIINDDVKELFTEETTEIITENVVGLVSEESKEVVNDEVKELVTEEITEVIKENVKELVSEESKEVVNDEVKELNTEEITEVIKENVKELVSEESKEVVYDEVKEPEVMKENVKELVSEESKKVVNDEVKELVTEEPNKEITEEVKGILTEEPKEVKEVINKEIKEVVIEETKVGIELEKDGIVEKNISKTTNSKQKSIDNQKSVSSKRSFSGLSNTLDILSDDEDDNFEAAVMQTPIETENKCINIEDDDDVMLIDEEITTKDDKKEPTTFCLNEEDTQKDPEKKQVDEVNVSKSIEENQDISKIECNIFDNREMTQSTETALEIDNPSINEKAEAKTDTILKVIERKPLVPPNFLKTFKKNVAEMTRDELEEFCLLKIVEGVVDRSSLSEIKSKLKTISQNMEEWRKKAMMLTKQNRDLQIVLKTVQEEQKKKPDVPIAPLKITRSVGMQVYMAENNERGVKRKVSNHTPPQNTRNRPAVNPSPSTPAPNVRVAKPNNNNAQIPVPRLVLASNSSPAKNTKPANSIVQNCTVSSNSEKASPVANGVKPPPPVKPAEKRSFSTVQSVTVDLTDDEPPAKQMATSRNPTQASPVRLVNQNQLMGPRAQSFNQQSNNGGPRKVYIPINQNQGIRAGQTIMLKSVQTPTPRPRGNGPMIRLPGPMRIPRPSPTLRHPAPLPTVAKQSQPPNWKALPPAPDLKISKVENGIVISWKIEGYQEDSYETIASYQLYAYQETSSPSTLLWKKIGDVKALPLPMACTLTQFVAGYKYYFAVRAVDVRSRIGPFSLPGSILLLNK